jgi:3-oxoacyl-[acyl-carrier-protein] synthase II
MSTIPVVITGMGVCSAGGCGVSGFWDQLLSGESCVGPIRRFDASAYPSQIAAEIADEAFGAYANLSARWSTRGRIARYAAAAAAEALHDSRFIAARSNAHRVGVAIAAGMSSYRHDEVFTACAASRRSPDAGMDWRAFEDAWLVAAGPDAAPRRTPGSIAALIAGEAGFRGPVIAPMTACAGGTQAIGDALHWIRAGRADVVLAGGSDCEIHPLGLASFCLLGALSTHNDEPARASRPFDAARDGFVLGEGAGAVVLERLDHAVRRGARIYAEVAGFGSACDAYRVTDPHPDGTGALLAMRRALDDAQASIDEVGYVNAHGTSTPANDRIETAALKHLFGARAPRVPISSTKSMIGHATVAAGAIEAVATAMTLVSQTLHPTINQEQSDPACDLDYVPNRARAWSVDVALSNSFAFGGQTAALVLRRVTV